MTKIRAPLTLDAAIGRIMGALPNHWADIAAITGRSENSVRKWADPDSGRVIPTDCAIALDRAYRRAGGEGAPIYECYGLQLELEGAGGATDQAAIIQAASVCIKENAEATQAQLSCALPGADQADFIVAVRQTEESVAAGTHTLALLTRRAGLLDGGGRASPGGET